MGRRGSAAGGGLTSRSPGRLLLLWSVGFIIRYGPTSFCDQATAEKKSFETKQRVLLETFRWKLTNTICYGCAWFTDDLMTAADVNPFTEPSVKCKLISYLRRSTLTAFPQPANFTTNDKVSVPCGIYFRYSPSAPTVTHLNIESMEQPERKNRNAICALSGPRATTTR